MYDSFWCTLHESMRIPAGAELPCKICSIGTCRVHSHVRWPAGAREATKSPTDHSVLSYMHNMKAARVSEVSSRAFHAFSLEMTARARSAGAPGAPPATGVEGTLQVRGGLGGGSGNWVLYRQ
jgi:hypothetical protein